MGDLLARLQRRSPAPPRVVTTPADAWVAAAGNLADVTQVLRTSRNGVVTVACADASVAQEVSARSDELVDALTAALGRPVVGVRAVIADHAIVTPRAPRPRPVVPGPAAQEAASGLADAVEDPEVRAAVQRAVAAAFQRHWDR